MKIDEIVNITDLLFDKKLPLKNTWFYVDICNYITFKQYFYTNKNSKYEGISIII